MQYRTLGKTGFNVSTTSFGCWAIGGTWGPVDDRESMQALHRAVDLGINFFDTADVYGDGHSERLVGRLLKETKETIYVATKAGRRLNPHNAVGYKELTPFIERSLTNLGVEAIDLLQLHCPPTDVYYMPEVFGALDDLVNEGKLKHYGVSVERIEEALKAIEFENVKTLQIIYNILRQRPAERLFTRCLNEKIGILARVPLASGLLTGRMKATTTFEADDHRNFNRHGEAFDVGETFAGIPYDVGLEVVEELRKLVPQNTSMAAWALRYILMQEAVTCTIPGAKNVAQVESNVRAADLPPLSDESMSAIAKLYEARIKPIVHQRW
jgi:aryl-alcohol dehydrogenase-like predicted oxidoreductase